MDDRTKSLFRKLFHDDDELSDLMVSKTLIELILTDSIPCINAVYDAKETGDVNQKY
jgi:hypothetical protein